MVSVTELLAEHQTETGLSGDLLKEEIAFLYTGIRLKNVFYLPKKKGFNDLCNTIVNHFIKDNYSLDCMINAVYNYYKKYNDYPPTQLINDNIEIFLNTYCVALEHFTKAK